jgi:hypothetical protein
MATDPSTPPAGEAAEPAEAAETEAATETA